jgi:PAS domain S-box-containing protein
MPVCLILIDHDGNFTYVNPKFKELFGYDLPDVPSVKTCSKRPTLIRNTERLVVSAWTDDFKNRRSGQRRPRVFDVTCKDGSVKVIEFITVEVETGEYIVSCEDITQQKQLEEQLRTMSIIDDLTGFIQPQGIFHACPAADKNGAEDKKAYAALLCRS